VPLNETGRAQAGGGAGLLRHRGITTILASPLSRALYTAETVADPLGLGVEVDDDLHEAAYGTMEGQPMTQWFDDWVAERSTPPGAESFAALRRRAVGAINRALTRPAPVLIVAHGALFRALRAEMGLEANVRTPNAMPLFCTPGTPWTLTPAAG
jgi:probable phosphoglycerate mutase